MTEGQALAVALIGFGGGVAGGLLGIGGSIVMIPLLAFALGPNQQLYQASCMTVNVVVAVGAALRHAKAGSVRGDCFRWMLPASTLAIVVGVLVSNRVPSATLQFLFGGFLIYAAAVELVRAARRQRSDSDAAQPVAPRTAVMVGGATGLVAGLLGVGGGTIAVPLLRSLAKLPIRQAIGTSSAVMTVASVVGAIAKNAAIPALTGPDGTPLTLTMSLGLSALLAPTALVGAVVGARLTYVLPLNGLRLAFGVLIAVAGLRMVGALG